MESIAGEKYPEKKRKNPKKSKKIQKESKKNPKRKFYRFFVFHFSCCFPKYKIAKKEPRGKRMATDKIWKAAEKGDKKAIERCLEQGESINSCDPSFRNTPLHWAVLGNYQFDKNELIDFLVERGADLNARMTLGRTPLHFAAYYGFCETATHLLELGADSTIQDDKGMDS